MAPKCQPCQYRIENIYRCKNTASCRLGCHLYCWIHASVHGIGQYCQDQGDLTIVDDDSASKRIKERLSNHLLELSQLRDDMVRLQIPENRMHELHTQFNTLRDLLFEK